VLGFEHGDADDYGVMDEDLEAGVRLLDATGFDADPDQPVSDAMLRDLASRAAKLGPSFDLGLGQGAAGGIDWNGAGQGWESGNAVKQEVSNYSDFLVKLFNKKKS